MMSAGEIRRILEDPSRALLEDLAGRAARLTRQYFGRAVSLYAPLYLSNYCENRCLYCGFHQGRGIRRQKLDRDGMRREMGAVAAMGIRSILLLTGESRVHTPPEYIRGAVEEARAFFPAIAVEIYPLEEDEYRDLVAAGVDGVTLYQETFARDRYARVHPEGRKADYDWRLDAPRRMAKAGIRTIQLGALMGLWDPAEDAAALFSYLHDMEKHFPGVEYSLSFPRIVPVNASLDYFPVSDEGLVKLLALARLEFPRVGISLSTRERARMRDHALEIAVTRLSAASRTTVGGYGDAVAAAEEDAGDAGQFEVRDSRSVAEIVAMLRERGFDPVFTDWRRF
ncbi:MAG: 2-iminoacetate synthase ThiH [Acidobacteria bacterium]|nr:2-iminoacetate synthase ThiH [Acidobacteriota bacterium]